MRLVCVEDRDVIEPQLRGEPAALPALTLACLPIWSATRPGVRPRTIQTLREQLPHATRAFGDVPLRDLERMTGEIASWQAKLPERSRYGIVQALRQTLDAAVRWGHMSRNPAKLAGPNRQPPPRPVRAFTREEVGAISAGCRPCTRHSRRLPRRPACAPRSGSGGEMVEEGKTAGARRQVPLTARARDALDAFPARLDTPLLFPAPRGGLLDLDHFRRREWAPAIEASGVQRPARIYDLRSTFASEALEAGVGTTRSRGSWARRCG